MSDTKSMGAATDSLGCELAPRKLPEKGNHGGRGPMPLRAVSWKHAHRTAAQAHGTQKGLTHTRRQVHATYTRIDGVKHSPRWPQLGAEAFDLWKQALGMPVEALGGL